jgi:hypothetical protein
MFVGREHLDQVAEAAPSLEEADVAAEANKIREGPLVLDLSAEIFGALVRQCDEERGDGRLDVLILGMLELEAQHPLREWISAHRADDDQFLEGAPRGGDDARQILGTDEEDQAQAPIGLGRVDEKLTERLFQCFRAAPHFALTDEDVGARRITDKQIGLAASVQALALTRPPKCRWRAATSTCRSPSSPSAWKPLAPCSMPCAAATRSESTFS